MGKHLTDRQIKKIIADYVETGNYSAVARKHGVSVFTVKKHVLDSPETTQKLMQKKEQNTLDILAYMDSKNASIKAFADYVLDVRLDPGKNTDELGGVSLPQLVTVFGVVIDKALKAKECSAKIKTDEASVKTNQNMLALADLLSHPVPDRKLEDDG